MNLLMSLNCWPFMDTSSSPHAMGFVAKPPLGIDPALFHDETVRNSWPHLGQKRSIMGFRILEGIFPVLGRCIAPSIDATIIIMACTWIAVNQKLTVIVRPREKQRQRYYETNVTYLCHSMDCGWLPSAQL